MTGGDEYAALQLQLVLLPLLLLHDLLLLVLRLVLSLAAFHALAVHAVLAAAQLRVSFWLILLCLIFINALNLVFVLLLIRDVKKFEQDTLDLALIVIYDLHEESVPDDAHSLLLKNAVDL